MEDLYSVEFSLELEGYIFTTDNETKYVFSFIIDNRINDIKNTNYSNIFSIDITCLTENKKYDEKTSYTIIDSIYKAFEDITFVLNYTCDISDGRGEARRKKFDYWFSKASELNSSIIKIDISVPDDELQDVNHYASLLIHNDNPLKDEIIKNYQESCDDFLSYK